MICGAIIDGQYRYRLDRFWNESGRTLYWVMLNPSTADALNDDATIRRCIDFSMRWGYGGIWVFNLFALRSRSPARLLEVSDSVGPMNNGFLDSANRCANDLVLAWGSLYRSPLAGRGAEICRIFVGRQSVYCLGLTKHGHPRHPLYVRRVAKLIPFPLPETR